MFQLRLHIGEARREVHAEPRQDGEVRRGGLLFLLLWQVMPGERHRRVLKTVDKRIGRAGLHRGFESVATHVARHAVSTKITILCLVAGLASIIVFFLYRRASPPIWMWIALVEYSA